MVTVKVIWAEEHSEEQSTALNAYCTNALNQGKLKNIEFAEDGSPIMTFSDSATAEEYVTLITPWNPSQIIRQ